MLYLCSVEKRTGGDGVQERSVMACRNGRRCRAGMSGDDVNERVGAA
ncbi:MAG: hypothetical protein IJP75_01320 [Bacteroidaceae bacterium]|nr:hypothetical protein [Bacteroidaceae bacterium]